MSRMVTRPVLVTVIRCRSVSPTTIVSGQSVLTVSSGADTLVTIPRPKSNWTRAWILTSATSGFGRYDSSMVRVWPGSRVFRSHRVSVSLSLSVGGGSQPIGSAFFGGVTRTTTLRALAREAFRTCSL